VPEKPTRLSMFDEPAQRLSMFDSLFDEAPPSADPIQPRERGAAASTRLARSDDAPSEHGSVPDDESLAGMEERLANRVELGVTAPILKQQLKLPVAPAYEDDDVVEYYAVKQEQWILARMQVDLQRPSLQNVPAGNIHYNVLIGQVSKQLRQDVPLDVLRPPLERSEAVEVFSLRGGGSWLPAYIDRDQPGDTNLGYNIRLHPGGQELRRIPATRLRRRFPSRMVVRVYKGPDLGWARMIVHPAAGKDGAQVRGLSIAEATPHLQSKSTPLEQWSFVPVCKETDMPQDDDSEGSEMEFDPSKLPEPELLPSYLIRAQMLEMPAPDQSDPQTVSAKRSSNAWCSVGERRTSTLSILTDCAPTSPKSPKKSTASGGSSGMLSLDACAPEPPSPCGSDTKRRGSKSPRSPKGGAAKSDSPWCEPSEPSKRKRAPAQRKEGDGGSRASPETQYSNEKR